MKSTYDNQSKAIQSILDLFVKSKKNLNETSAKNYKNSVPLAFETCDFSSDSERNFLILLPKLLKVNCKNDIKELINLIRRSVILFDWGSNRKSYKTYISQFLTFIENKTNTDKKIENLKKIIFGDEEDKNYYLTEKEKVKLKEDFEKNVVFTYDCLLTKFKSRLRTQERTSGDKIWLPLSYIAKIYRKNNKSKTNDFTTWLSNMTKDIYIHYMIEKDNEIRSIQFNKKSLWNFRKKMKMVITMSMSFGVMNSILFTHQRVWVTRKYQ